MEKKRFFQILSRTDGKLLASLSREIEANYKIVVVKEPSKTLTMIQMREPVKQSLFYLGEVIVCEAVVELDGVKGACVTMGDDVEKTLHMAILDAAVNKGVFERMSHLLDLEREQKERLMRENAMHLKTMVNFESMDQEVPKDVNAYQKA